MRKKWPWAIGALTVLAAGFVVVQVHAAFSALRFLGDPPATTAPDAPLRAPEPVVAAPPRPEPPAIPPERPLVAETLPFDPPPHEQADRPPPPPPPGTWEAAPLLARGARLLGTVGRDLQNGLAALRPQLAACQALDGPRSTGAAALLVLYLEQTAGAVRIVDAPVESEGAVGPRTLACAQHVLRGQVLPARDARQGQRARMPFPISP